MTLRSSFALALSLASFHVAACGGSSLPEGGGGSTNTNGAGGTHPPTVHRPAEIACTEARPPGGTWGDPLDHCKVDSDCADGANGRCVAPLGKPAFCSYDECAADADCGAVTVCECRLAPNYQANTCVHGTCRVDADCGAEGYCSPSGVSIFSNCLEGVPVGSIGYFCHTAEDECADDADCGEPPSAACLFDVPTMRWRCRDLVCTR